MGPALSLGQKEKVKSQCSPTHHAPERKKARYIDHHYLAKQFFDKLPRGVLLAPTKLAHSNASYSEAVGLDAFSIFKEGEEMQSK